MVHLSERDEQLPDHVIGRLLELLVEDPSVLSLGAGEPDFELPQPLVNEVRRVAHKVNHYSPPGGRTELREAICKKLKKENKIKAGVDNITVTCGSQEALMLATTSTLDVSEQILLPNPGYMGFLPTFELFNAGWRYYDLHETTAFEPNPDDIRRGIDKKKTKVLLLNSPANPTGNVIRRKILEEIADIAVEYDLAVFSDEAYEHVIYDNAKHVSIGSLNGMDDRTFTFQTFSKSAAMCGFRLGYVVAPEEFSKAMKKTHIYSTVCAPTVSQLVGLKALAMSARHRERMVKEYDRRRKVIVPRLNEMGLTTPMPRGAFYAFANVAHIMPSSKQFAFDLLKKEKVAVVPGVDFGPGGESFIRLSYATELSIIEKALDRLERFVGASER